MLRLASRRALGIAQLWIILSAGPGYAQVLSTIAGNGDPTFSSDGGPAAAAVNRARGLAVDAAGYLRIADTLVDQATSAGAILHATVSYVRLAPDLVGLYQVNAQAPASVAAGNQPVCLTINRVASNTATIAVTR